MVSESSWPETKSGQGWRQQEELPPRTAGLATPLSGHEWRGDAICRPLAVSEGCVCFEEGGPEALAPGLSLTHKEKEAVPEKPWDPSSPCAEAVQRYPGPGRNRLEPGLALRGPSTLGPSHVAGWTREH